MTLPIPDTLTGLLSNTPTITFGGVINLSSVNWDMGNELCGLTAKYLVEELRTQFYTESNTEDTMCVQTWLKDNKDYSRWLYENVDYTDIATDPFTLDEMYIADGQLLGIALAEVKEGKDYAVVKEYLAKNKDTIVDLTFNYGDTYVVCLAKQVKEVP